MFYYELVLNCFEKRCPIFNATFKVVKMNFGSKFGLGYLSIPLLNSPESFEKIGGGRVAVLPL